MCRSAFEFARSVSLYESKYTALKDLDKKLKGLYDKDVQEASLKLKALDEEHCNWMRLMIEADW